MHADCERQQFPQTKTLVSSQLLPWFLPITPLFVLLPYFFFVLFTNPIVQTFAVKAAA